MRNPRRWWKMVRKLGITGSRERSDIGEVGVVRQRKEAGMKVIRHAGVDSRMIILDDQARQQMTLHFQLSLQCNVLPITGFVRHTAKKT